MEEGGGSEGGGRGRVGRREGMKREGIEERGKEGGRRDYDDSCRHTTSTVYLSHI